MVDCRTTILNTDILTDSDLFEKWYSLMPCYRKNKIDLLKFDSGKRLSLGAGILLYVAMKESGICPNIQTELSEDGKPFLPNYPKFNFNLSHSGSRAMISISNCPVGCDVEKIEKPHFDIAKRFFSEKENALLDSVDSEEEKNKLFYEIWTLKESFVKTNGRGLSLDFKKFSVIPENKEVTLDQSEDSFKYIFKHPYSEENYSYSCCLKTDQPVVLYANFINNLL